MLLKLSFLSKIQVIATMVLPEEARHRRLTVETPINTVRAVEVQADPREKEAHLLVAKAAKARDVVAMKDPPVSLFSFEISLPILLLKIFKLPLVALERFAMCIFLATSTRSSLKVLRSSNMQHLKWLGKLAMRWTDFR
jgi:hypothetical protein